MFSCHEYIIFYQINSINQFEDAADIGATAQHLDNHEEGQSLQIIIINIIYSRQAYKMYILSP